MTGFWLKKNAMPIPVTRAEERGLISGECWINTCWTSNIRQFDGMLSATSVKDALNKTAPVSPILVQGWVRTRRDAKDFSFIELNDGSSLRNLQIIAKNSLPNYADVQRLITGASIKVRGELAPSQGKGQSWEVVADELTIVGRLRRHVSTTKKRAYP